MTDFECRGARYDKPKISFATYVVSGLAEIVAMHNYLFAAMSGSPPTPDVADTRRIRGVLTRLGYRWRRQTRIENSAPEAGKIASNDPKYLPMRCAGDNVRFEFFAPRLVRLDRTQFFERIVEFGQVRDSYLRFNCRFQGTDRPGPRAGPRLPPGYRGRRRCRCARPGWDSWRAPGRRAAHRRGCGAGAPSWPPAAR